MNKLKTAFIGLMVAAVSFTGIQYLAGSDADALNASARDCDNNSIIYCGAISASELKSKYDANATKDLPQLYSHYGISSSMINGKTQKSGYVTRSGNVVYNGKVVATGAQSVGRQYMSGSSSFTVAGHKFYQRPTSVSFASDAIAAHIWFDSKGQYVGAILYSCGNAVAAKPVPVTPKPTPKPVYKCSSLVATKISRTQFSFKTTASASNGATITGYTYTFGDGSTAQGGATINHSYAKAGTYQASVKVSVKVNGKIVTAPGTCTATVTVAPEMCPIPGKEQYPVGDERCVEDKPAVEITKLVDGQKQEEVAVGSPFDYEITVKNTGNVALKDAVVTDAAPAGVTFLSADKGQITDNTWTYTIPSLAVGASETFTIQAKLPAYKAGDIVNKACVETPTVPGGNPDDCDTATVTTKPHTIKVCDTTTNTIVVIDEGQADNPRYTTDLSKCEKAPTPPTTPELPHTGMGDTLASLAGAGSLIGVGLAYLASRRAVR